MLVIVFAKGYSVLFHYCFCTGRLLQAEPVAPVEPLEPPARSVVIPQKASPTGTPQLASSGASTTPQQVSSGAPTAPPAEPSSASPFAQPVPTVATPPSVPSPHPPTPPTAQTVATPQQASPTQLTSSGAFTATTPAESSSADHFAQPLTVPPTPEQTVSTPPSVPRPQPPTEGNSTHPPTAQTVATLASVTTRQREARQHEGWEDLPAPKRRRFYTKEEVELLKEEFNLTVSGIQLHTNCTLYLH